MVRAVIAGPVDRTSRHHRQLVRAVIAGPVDPTSCLGCKLVFPKPARDMEMRMTTFTIFEADDLVLRVPVTFEPGSLITTLVGATVEAFAARPGGALVLGAVSVSGEEAMVTFDGFSFVPGHHELQVVVTKTGQSQTVASADLEVRRSLKPRP